MIEDPIQWRPAAGLLLPWTNPEGRFQVKEPQVRKSASTLLCNTSKIKIPEIFQNTQVDLCGCVQHFRHSSRFLWSQVCFNDWLNKNIIKLWILPSMKFRGSLGKGELPVLHVSRSMWTMKILWFKVFTWSLCTSTFKMSSPSKVHRSLPCIHSEGLIHSSCLCLCLIQGIKHELCSADLLPTSTLPAPGADPHGLDRLLICVLFVSGLYCCLGVTGPSSL